MKYLLAIHLSEPDETKYIGRSLKLHDDPRKCSPCLVRPNVDLIIDSLIRQLGANESGGANRFVDCAVVYVHENGDYSIRLKL